MSSSSSYRNAYDLSQGGGFKQLAEDYRRKALERAARTARREADKYSPESSIGSSLQDYASRLEASAQRKEDNR
jgi:hypothetical protein